MIYAIFEALKSWEKKSYLEYPSKRSDRRLESGVKQALINATEERSIQLAKARAQNLDVFSEHRLICVRSEDVTISCNILVSPDFKHDEPHPSSLKSCRLSPTLSSKDF